MSEKVIYLTFDDGPIPDLTSYVLEQLDLFKAKATFFCVGDNIGKHPDIFKKVLARDHGVGNHTFNHLKAWSTGMKDFLSNVKECQEIIDRYIKKEGKPLMRPPHGQITKGITRELKEHYQLIMWDVLSYDFNMKHSPEVSLKKIIKKTRPGSIIVFHDNYKAESKLKYMLPRYLKHFAERGYQFKKLHVT